MLRHPGAVDGDRILAEFSAWLKQAQGCEAEARVMAEIAKVRGASTSHHKAVQDMREEIGMAEAIGLAQVRDLKQNLLKAQGEIGAAMQNKADMERAFHEEIANLQSLISARHVEIETMKAAQNHASQFLEGQVVDMQGQVNAVATELEEASETVQALRDEAEARLNVVEAVRCRAQSVHDEIFWQATNVDANLCCEMKKLTSGLAELTDALGDNRALLAELHGQLAIVETFEKKPREGQLGLKLEQLTKDLDIVAGEVFQMRKWLGPGTWEPQCTAERLD